MKVLIFDNTQSKETPGLHHITSICQISGWNTCKKVMYVTILLPLCLLSAETVRSESDASLERTGGKYWHSFGSCARRLYLQLQARQLSSM